MRNSKNDSGKSSRPLSEKETKELASLAVQLGTSEVIIMRGTLSKKAWEGWLSTLMKITYTDNAPVVIFGSQETNTNTVSNSAKRKSKNSTNSNKKSPKTTRLKKRLPTTMKN